MAELNMISFNSRQNAKFQKQSVITGSTKSLCDTLSVNNDFYRDE